MSQRDYTAALRELAVLRADLAAAKNKFTLFFRNNEQAIKAAVALPAPRPE
jgi:hypothetical protein